jgi:hypothetical protein
MKLNRKGIVFVLIGLVLLALGLVLHAMDVTVDENVKIVMWGLGGILFVVGVMEIHDNSKSAPVSQ